MTWSLTNEETEEQLRLYFQERKINCAAPGFIDSPEFLVEEQRNPRILERYANFIEAKHYSPEYLAEAAEKILTVVNAVHEAVKHDGRKGACVDASGMMGRMLDELAVWNYVAKATLTIDYPPASKLNRSHFWEFDFGEFAAPHAFVVAPPFGIIDATIQLQHWNQQQEKYLPSYIATTDFSLTAWSEDDLANDALLDLLRKKDISFSSFISSRRPGMLDVISTLPPRRLSIEGVDLKYVVIAVGGTIEKLADITGYMPSGRSALNIFQEDVLPQLS